ncbi:hypothetical protein [Novosphingobium aquimarinum]|uniref:hypothetical protein n=1 Tax=Novosphingobium aquimarinum TaxID=2682494 RepID=UPI0012EB8F6E|nr:hypothetical protein [Novosphingobium aquimarinum]
MLSPYDEFPIHQTSHTFASIPSTDFSWDDGCYFGFFSPAEKVFLAVGYRVNPNSDIIGGFAILNVDGKQHTTRFSRCWRRDMTTRVGPFAVEVMEPLRKLRVSLDENETGLSFDLVWTGVSPAVLEEHHLAENRMRRTTDQSRYCQAGEPSGFIRFGEQHWQVDPAGWSCARDHSWGLYAERRPLSPDPRWLPPKIVQAHQRALRFWIILRAGPFSGFFHLHEDADGVQRDFSDVFGTALGGSLFAGWDSKFEIATARHEAVYQPGTRLLSKVVMAITDTQGGNWKLEFEAVAPPWIAQTSGYFPGGWKDGGNVHTYHGSEELALESDSFDFSIQPIDYRPYQAEADTTDMFGAGSSKVQGMVYLCAVKVKGPDGTVGQGAAHVEHWINGRYAPYGFE